MNRPFSNPRRAEIEAWWALISRILAFFLGALVLVYAMVFATADAVEVRLMLIGVAAGLMGPMAAAGVAQVIAAMRGGGERE